MILTLGIVSGTMAQKGYKIKVKVKGVSDTVCYLANYFGKSQYYKDTAMADKNGYMVFEGDEPLPGGIYSVVTPGLRYFEIIVNEQHFSLETDTSDFIANMKVKGSEENRLFYEYLNYIQKKTDEAKECREIVQSTDDEKKKEECTKLLTKVDEDVKNFRLKYIEEHKDMFIGTLFNAMREPEIPEPPKGLSKDEIQEFRYRYYKNHYWETMDMSDDRLIRTPVYHNKLSKYFNQLVLNHPDTVIVEADYVVGMVDSTKELFKYTVHFITNKYEKSKYVCMDKVFVHMADTYYCTGRAFWVDSTQMKKICDRADKLRPIRCGSIAPNIILPDTSEKNWINMHQLNTDFTLLIFWDPDCGHCKKEIPKIVEIMEEYKDKSISVYAVSSESNNDWKKFIKDKEMDFYNVAVPKEIYKNQDLATELVLSGKTTLESLNYHDTYDIYSTPQIYFLDSEKRILAKKLNHTSIKNILEEELGKKGEEKE